MSKGDRRSTVESTGRVLIQRSVSPTWKESRGCVCVCVCVCV